MNPNGPFAEWFSRQKITLLRWSIAVSYAWFGALKFFPGMSPAEGLAKDTIRVLSFGLIPDHVSILLLAVWEVGIGLAFFSGRLVRYATWAAIVHIVCTFTPLFFFPDVSFTHAPYAFSIIGQYIVKNLVFLVALGILLQEERERAAV